MDVVCGRCRAEYEFDDALISERGTNVRCTNCGLQFKIFPPVGLRSVELWLVYREGRLDSPILEYKTLEELQRGIVSAEVKKGDWLSRGDSKPRPLAEIVELQPLLGQRQSERPPSADQNQADDYNGEFLPPLRLGSSGTVIGIAMRHDHDLSPPVDAPSPPQALVPQHAPVPQPEPAQHAPPPQHVPPPQHAPPPQALEPQHAPVPQTEPEPPSALTSEGIPQDPQSLPPESIKELPSEVYNAMVENWVQEIEEEDAQSSSNPSAATEDFARTRLGYLPTSPMKQDPASKPKVRSALSRKGALSGPDSSSIRPPRASLLSRTFIGGTAPPVEAPLSGERHSSIPPPLPGQVHGEEASGSPSHTAASANFGHAPGRASFSVAQPSQFAGSDSGPPSSRSSQSDMSAHSSAAPSSRPGLGPSSTRRGLASPSQEPTSDGRNATFSVLLVLVAAAAGVLLAWSQIRATKQQPTDPSEELVEPPDLEDQNSLEEQPEASAGAPKPSESPQVKEVATAVQNLEIAWWKNMLSDSDSVALPAADVSDAIEQVGEEPSWTLVSLLRLSGQVERARAVAMKLSTEDADYASASLDLVESKDPPWPILTEKYKTASMGEQSPFLARVALIYTLASSKQLDAARADYRAFSLVPEASQSPLFAPLGIWLEKQGGPPSGEPVTVAGTDEAAAERATAEKTITEKAVAEKASKERTVSAAIKLKVDQADTLWRSGGREQAVVLYRQVVSEIGTSHFLGQRSAARIAQAAREKSDGEASQ